MDAASESQMYVALLVYESASAAPGYEPLYAETVTLVRATSTEHAAERAREFAVGREAEYLNVYGETIRWSLKHVVDVSEVDSLDDGAEVYTRHFRDYDAYRAFEMLDLS